MTMQGQGGNGNGAPPPAGGSGAPPAGGQPSGATQPPAGAGAAGDDDDLDQPMTLREARALRREAAQARGRIAGFEEAERTRQQQGLTELERERARATAAETALETERANLRNERLSIRIETAAARLGFIDPEAAVRLLDRSSIEFDEQGNPKGLDKALKDLLSAKPYLKGQAQGSANAGEGNRGGAAPTGSGMNDLIRRGAGRGVATDG
jgi:hypothetical protein